MFSDLSLDSAPGGVFLLVQFRKQELHTMGNPRKPTQLKVISGTNRPCRDTGPHIEIELVSELPEAPDWLPTPHAVNEFNRLASILHANRLLTPGGVGALAHMCALYGKLVQLWRAGETPSGHLMAQYRNLSNDFGLTPVAQGKVAASGDKPADRKSVV